MHSLFTLLKKPRPYNAGSFVLMGDHAICHPRGRQSCCSKGGRAATAPGWGATLHTGARCFSTDQAKSWPKIPPPSQFATSQREQGLSTSRNSGNSWAPNTSDGGFSLREPHLWHGSSLGQTAAVWAPAAAQRDPKPSQCLPSESRPLTWPPPLSNTPGSAPAPSSTAYFGSRRTPSFLKLRPTAVVTEPRLHSCGRDQAEPAHPWQGTGQCWGPRKRPAVPAANRKSSKK